MAHVSHRLRGAFEGALAGGGDPASSPLYVFGPFLRLLAASGAGAAAFGAPIWMVVATVFVVSVMYRHVMHWVPDGSGGSGLCEEEFGSWAVKVNASITAIEYTLTFLVSIAALVTFIADRVGGLAQLGRTALAVLLSAGVGVVVNRGPRIAARVFGPATAAVLALLWLLVGAVLWRRGLHLPPLSIDAFDHVNRGVTLGGYVRLLALMTGIEVFANLVAAYDGPPAARANKAVGSLVIVMATTLITMVVVGPAIYELADPARTDVSVFTQTMDRLLPRPMAYAGTLVGIVVLLSAAAASAQGLQNLALGLRQRHYVPASFGQRNRFDVADRPVLLQVAVVVLSFVAFGTSEETYLALYAAGVFVLLALTGWASVKRLVREARLGASSGSSIVTTILAASVTSAAAGLIFAERFLDGAWAYAVLVPALYGLFSAVRRRLGAPTRLAERLGRILAETRSFLAPHVPDWPHVLGAAIDGSLAAEPAIVAASVLGDLTSAPVALLRVGGGERDAYSIALRRAFRLTGDARTPRDASEVLACARDADVDLLVVSRDLPGTRSFVRESDVPVLVVPGAAEPPTRYTQWRRVLVGLDGSREAESTLPYCARLLQLGAALSLVLVPDGDTRAEPLEAYGQKIAEGLASYGAVDLVVGGSGPARTLVERAREGAADLVVVARHGRGGVERAAAVPLGSVPGRLLSDLACALLIVPASAAREGASTAPASSR